MKARIVLFALAFAACGDPVREDRENAVPDDGKRDGPEHHVGYQCTACHTDGQFRGPPVFSFAGTVFKYRDDTRPLDQRGLSGAKVIIYDRASQRYETITNSVGNFYVNRDSYDPPYPVTVYIEGPNGQHIVGSDGLFANQMRSHIGREGGCAFCHKLGSRNEQSWVPEIYFARTEAELRDAGISP
jgi:hypothetical protein